jgi:COP9 signalosome complex subunit 1
VALGARLRPAQSRGSSPVNHQVLEKLKPDLLLDIHLHDHVEALYADVRSKALIQYFSPFVTVDMKLMADAFNTPVMDLERELAKLIMAGQIPARIDSHNKVLHARHADQRTSTFQKALAMGDDYVRDSMALLLRINLMRHDFVVKPASGDAGLGPSKSSRQERRTVDRMPIAFDAGL